MYFFLFTVHLPGATSPPLFGFFFPEIIPFEDNALMLHIFQIPSPKTPVLSQGVIFLFYHVGWTCSFCRWICLLASSFLTVFLSLPLLSKRNITAMGRCKRLFAVIWHLKNLLMVIFKFGWLWRRLDFCSFFFFVLFCIIFGEILWNALIILEKYEVYILKHCAEETLELLYLPSE